MDAAPVHARRTPPPLQTRPKNTQVRALVAAVSVEAPGTDAVDTRAKFLVAVAPALTVTEASVWLV